MNRAMRAGLAMMGAGAVGMMVLAFMESAALGLVGLMALGFVVTLWGIE